MKKSAPAKAAERHHSRSKTTLHDQEAAMAMIKDQFNHYGDRKVASPRCKPKSNILSLRLLNNNIVVESRP